MGCEEEKHFNFSSFYCLLFPSHERKSMFAVLHSDINSIKSGLVHLTGQPFCKKSRSAKVKDWIINLFLWNYLVDRYKGTAMAAWFYLLYILFSTGILRETPSTATVGLTGLLTGWRIFRLRPPEPGVSPTDPFFSLSLTLRAQCDKTFCTCNLRIF